MPYRVVLTASAEKDVASVLRWFSEQRATEAGKRWYARLTDLIASLENHPERCSLAPESEDIGLEIREVLLGRRQYKYRILFTISGQSVVVLRVWHGARDSFSADDLIP